MYEGEHDDKGILRFGTAMVVYHFVSNLYLAVVSPKGVGFPGGKNEPGETPWQAAHRETFEETGYEVPREGVLSLPTIDADNGMLTYGFATTCWDVMPIIRSSDEGVACWVAMEALIGKRARFPLYNKNILGAFHSRRIAADD